MIAYFPAIYPDELVYSWFCRYYVHSGFFSSKSAMQELYCKRSDNPSKEFIGNLNSEAKVRIDRMYPLEKLVLNHTMYPQYARFIPLEQKKTALYRLEHDNCDAHHLFCILPRADGEQHLRYQKLREQGKLFYWSDIREISGVKKKHIQAIIPYLVKHTDVDTVNQIVSLMKI